MSTRSGKRIHSSFDDKHLQDNNILLRSERKTRSKHLKENCEELDVSSIKVKKRSNYVAYPIDNEIAEVATIEKDVKNTRNLRRNTLKELNTISDDIPETRSVRKSRRTNKVVDDDSIISKDSDKVYNVPEIIADSRPKIKKSKKKKAKTDTESNECEATLLGRKKSKKKKAKRSNSVTVEHLEVNNDNNIISTLNKSNTSVDSFHSAAGSPLKNDSHKNFKQVNNTEEIIKVTKTRSRSKDFVGDVVIVNNNMDIKRKRTRSFNKPDHMSSPDRKSITKTAPVINEIDCLETTDNYVNTPSKRKSSKKDATFDKTENELILSSTKKKKSFNILDTSSSLPSIQRKNSRRSSMHTDTRCENVNLSENNVNMLDSTLEKCDINFIKDNKKSSIICASRKSRKSSIIKVNDDTFKKDSSNLLNGTFDSHEKHNDSKVDKADSSIDKVDKKKHNPIFDNTLHSTFEKILDSTFDNDIQHLHSTFDKDSAKLDSTFDKDSAKLDSTFDKNNKKKYLVSDLDNRKLNSTFDKNTKHDSLFDRGSKKLDTTFDTYNPPKTSLESKASILTSDGDSNATYDKANDSRISISSDESKNEIIVNTTPVLIESSMEESVLSNSSLDKTTSPRVTNQTPLKREGTFTKKSPEVKLPAEKTPLKRVSLPSPGCTPFPFSNSSQKEKYVMNVTRSIEKSRRSSLAEALHRTPKVMFCSPIDIPVITEKRKIIKSNLKGSNKSFVFEDSGARPAARKRSFTHNDAEDARVKRKRLADDMQQSVDRLSRPRTSSATGKLPTTPSKKTVTPQKSKSSQLMRTKLPNFAALHQRRFEKMESLDECQERKAKRAKQLLTPTGSVTVLERSSPKEASEECKEPPKTTTKPETPSIKAKLETPTKTLKAALSTNPGYTRFGFKLNLDVNPFSIPSKKQENKPKEIKPNGLKREPTLPSLTGTTSVRKEAAKQVVLREKSFTSLMSKRDVKRSENRNVIKGVRTNRRFDLQMKMRNILG